MPDAVASYPAGRRTTVTAAVRPRVFWLQWTP
jgi:hypothetical protein